MGSSAEIALVLEVASEAQVAPHTSSSYSATRVLWPKLGELGCAISLLATFINQATSRIPQGTSAATAGLGGVIVAGVIPAITYYKDLQGATAKLHMQAFGSRCRRQRQIYLRPGSSLRGWARC